MRNIYRPAPSIVGLVLISLLFIEIAGFIIVGKEIGVLATLALIILSMVVGFTLLRIEGITLLAKMQKELADGRVPNRELAHGALLIFAAFLLIIPGFVTDIIGILLFIPQIRDLIWRYMSKKMTIYTTFDTTFSQSDVKKDGEKIIDLDADDYHSSDPEHSPWRKNDDTKRLK